MDLEALTPQVEALLLGNGIHRWLLALGVLVAVLVAGSTVRRLARSRHEALAQTEAVEMLERPALLLSRIATPFLVLVSMAVAALTLDLPERIRDLLETGLTIALFWQGGIWTSLLVRSWIDQRSRENMKENRAAVGSLGILALVARGAIWSVVLLLTLDNLGVDVTALIAGMGVGGIAVALAVQNILGDLLASLSITLDKPFVIGDFLSVDDFLGTVEYIGIKSTRLRSLSGEQIVMSNTDLLTSRVRNYGRMSQRRVVFTIGITYETPREKVEKIPTMLGEIVDAQDNVRLDRCHFSAFGPFSLDFEIVYYVLSADYAVYMDVQQAINLAILERFEREGIEFAYPTQKLWIDKS